MKWETYKYILEQAEYVACHYYYCYYDEECLESRAVLLRELRFLKMFFWGFAYWEDLKYDWHMHFSTNTMMSKLGQSAIKFSEDCARVQFDENQQEMIWEEVTYDLVNTIREFKPQTRDICILSLGGSYLGTSCPSNQREFLKYGKDTTSFIELILQNLVTLQNSESMAPVMKQHIGLIQQGLKEFQMFVDPPNGLFNFISRTRAWFNRISCLLYLYWIEGSNESLASYMETTLSGLFHEIMPCTGLGPVSSYFRCTKIHQSLAVYLDFLLRDLVIPLRDDIHEGVVFLFSFIMDPPMDGDSKDSEMIWAQCLAAMKKFPSLIYSLGSVEMEGGVCTVDLSDFLTKVDLIKDQVRKLYVVAPYSSEFCSPSTDVIFSLDSMIRNLKEILLQEEVTCIPSLKHQSELLLNELVLLVPAVMNISKLPIDEDKEIQGLWTEFSNMIYNVDYFIKFCHFGGLSLWYGIVGLPSLVQAIMVVKIKINKKSSGHHVHMEEADVLQPCGTTSEIEGVCMGFVKEKRLIIDELTGGPNSLRIISISGSGGQGKTTLAKQIYNDPKVQCHFHRSGWGHISMNRPIKEILGQIIDDVNKGDDRKIDVTKYGVHELVDVLRKSLKGRRYFIVMDDIWDIDIWRKLELSFPDDKKGSRILFTSRNRDLASQAISNSISHPLPLFSDEESWELIRKRVFGSDNCDGELEGIGKEIASYCKGLPLAASLIAAVLGKTRQSLYRWKKVAGNLKGHLAEEGCGNVLKLSYRYLPNHLKLCFLYFGSFKRGEGVRAKELILTWISEGFVIPDREANSTETELATKYLRDLVSQGLVDVIERSSMGGIKRCNVHDLLYDLCLEICREDNFLHWEKVNFRYFDRRSPEGGPLIKISPSTRRSLPISSLHSFTCESYYFSERNFRTFKLLTVLKIRCVMYSKDFPYVISLIYLRHLEIEIDISGSIEAIPLGIANMWRLGVLIVDLVYDVPPLLPVSMWNMKSLRHVDIKDARLNLDDFDLGEPSKLFGGALNLEALGSLFLDVYDSRTTEFLRNIPKLRKLRCIVFRKIGQIMKLLSVVGSLLPHLESLGVQGEYDRVLYPMMEHPNQNPVIWSLPKNENLTKLNLIRTYIPWSVMSEIGNKLPNLRVLKLRYCSCVGEIWELRDGDFSKLTYLEISPRSGLKDIEEIDVSCCEELPFPCLEHLVLHYCIKLKEIPSIFGEHCSLMRIKVSKCPQRVEDSAKSILEQQREFGNESFQVMIDNTYTEPEI